MKYQFSFIILFFIANNLFAQLWWASINGETEFCPGDDRTGVVYGLNDNFTTIITYNISCTRCEMRLLNSNGPWLTSLTGVGPPNFTQIEVNWDSGNYDDAKLRYEVYGHWTWFRDKLGVDEHEIKLVDTNVTPTLTSNITSLSCGSTQSITFTADWANADSYNWTISGGTISGSTTGETITVIPTNGTTNVTGNVRGYNSSCNVYSQWKPRTITRLGPNVSSIAGPDYVCYGAPSVENHYVNYIPSVSYTWTGSGLTFPNGSSSPQVTVQGSSVGNKTLTVTVIGCGATVTKSKTVYVDNSTPMHPVIYQYPYTHCAGSCETYYLMMPTGYASEMGFRYNYGYWDVANSNGSIYVCSASYDSGSKPIELRAKGICGNYSTSYTESVQIDNCGYYMMNTSSEDSLMISQMNTEDEVILYPNPATTTMTVSLPEETREAQLTIIDDKNEVLTTFKNKKKLFTVNTSRFGSGYYYLNIVSKNKKTTKRFLVE